MHRQLLLGEPRLDVLVVLEGSKDSISGSDEVEHELNVSSPIARVVKDEDRGERNRREIDILLEKGRKSQGELS